MGDFSISETAFAVKLQTLEFASFLILEPEYVPEQWPKFLPNSKTL